MRRAEFLYTLALILVDAIFVMCAFVLAYFVRLKVDSLPISYMLPLVDYARWAAIFVPAWIVIFAVTGLYKARVSKEGIGGFKNIFMAVSTGTMLIVAVIFITRELFFSRLIVLYVWVLAVLLVPFGRGMLYFVKRAFRQIGWGLRKVIIIGTDGVAPKLTERIVKNPKIGYSVSGFISDRKGETPCGLPVLGTLADLDLVLARYKPDDVILASSEVKNKDIYELALQASKVGADFKLAPDTFALFTSYVSTSELYGIPLLDVKESPLFGWRRFLKRAFDLLIVFISLIILGLPMLIIAVLIKLTSKGPIFIRQQRVGRRGREFTFYKFRTMVDGADKMLEKLKKQNEATGPIFKMKRDPRVTTLGRVLRKFSIDELPQIFNVILGDMSIVGPRPPIPVEVAKYEEWHKQRLNITPGMTGLWQVSGRSDLTFEEMVKLDIFYIENWNMWLDLKVIMRTFGAVLFAKGAY